MKCKICYRIFSKGSFCKKCNELICPECRIRFNGNYFCKECYVDLFAWELVSDLSEALGIKDIERMMTKSKKQDDEKKYDVVVSGDIIVNRF
jgi:hypothetical protein